MSDGEAAISIGSTVAIGVIGIASAPLALGLGLGYLGLKYLAPDSYNTAINYADDFFS